MFLLAIALAFSLQFLSSVADPKNQLGFQCTNESNSQNYGCLVKENVLRFFVIGDIGGEEYTITDKKQQHQCTVEGHGTVDDCFKKNCPTVVKYYRPTEAQKAVAKAMHSLATNGKMSPHFLLNVGDNFYEEGVTYDDVAERFDQNFTKVYHQDSLNVPWYTIAGNDDWKSKDGIKPQIDYPTGKWTFPAQNYVVNYEFGKSPDERKRKTARFIMIDTTVLCGSGSSVFGKIKKKYAEKYAKMIEDAKKHFKWLRKELREAKRRQVHFLFLVGHCPLHILDKLPSARLYPCARRVMALMRFYQVQAYFAGHEHNLKHADLSSSKHGIRTQYIVSGAGSRMQNAIDEDRFPKQYSEEGYMKFLYPNNVGERLKNDDEISKAHKGAALDGGAFVGVEIDAEEMVAKLNFYAAGILYKENDEKVSTENVPIEKVPRENVPTEKMPDEKVPIEKVPTENVPIEKVPTENVPTEKMPDEKMPDEKVPTENVPTEKMPDEKVSDEEVSDKKVSDEKVPIDKWHKFERQEIKLNARDMTDENDDICNEFLALIDADEMQDDEHFKMDHKERIQAKLGKYFCKNMKENEKNEQNHPKEINHKFNWTTIDDDVQFYAEEAMGEMRKKFGITYKKLADSFLSDDLTELNSLGKSSSKFCRTEDERFLLKQIPQSYEVERIETTLKNYFDHMMKMGNESFINKIFMVFRVEIENTSTLFLLMENVFKNAKDLPLLNFDVKGVFSYQQDLVDVEQDQRLNDVVLKWYHFFGGEPPLVSKKMESMFEEGILLEKKTHQNIVKRLKSDFKVLAENNVNDWSIIFGVYFEQNGEHKTIAESSDEMPFFNATCNQCRNHPKSKKLNEQKLRLYIGIVDIFMPFKKVVVEKKNVDDLLTAYVNTGRILETFGPIWPLKYGERMLAFSMACAFRWKAENVVPSEAIRQALISAFCDSYGKSEQFKETEKLLEEAKKKKLTDLVKNEYSIGQYTVTIFGVELFKHLMEQSGKYSWDLLNDLAEGELKVTGKKFVVEKFGEKMEKEIFGNVLKNEPKTFALLSLKVKESDKEKCEFFKVISKHENDPKEEDEW
ncbi:hypothetical protein niasHT_035206 [Heterodera trifolii]|uniref:PIPK domain-containing protein n=1 Tax=Heterodera trifolii TaxID=157864 RepID=A0ABD2IMC5_9BILA